MNYGLIKLLLIGLTVYALVCVDHIDCKGK